jgi:ribokinase
MSVIVLGGINQDVVAHVTRLPRPGETVAASGVTHAAGGKGLNKAVAAAKFGARVTMLGAVGDDEAGRMLRETLTTAGVDDRMVATIAGVPTGQALITLAKNGENCIVVNPGANACVNITDLAAQVADGTVFLAEFEATIATVRQLFDTPAAQAGTRILNTAPALQTAEALAVLRLADILILNETELQAYAATAAPLDSHAAIVSAARTLIEPHQSAIVTLGAAGCLLIHADGSTMIASHVVTAVDTIGAGDCFCGVFAAALSGGMAMNEAIKHANAAAALSVGRSGAAAASPLRAEVLAFLNRA